ncbi:endonuclease/exonuclease/phosphatase family protein [Singulisphaera sp. PoT]|uniref:endonuclease/exonuclease/phosphatase family protein n=1 Tax=Singulisphaera sp. PoT TaxID=3411797 RepID=UPI003BF59CE9
MKSLAHRRPSGSFAALALLGGLALVGSLGRPAGAQEAPSTIRVLSFNLWHGGDAGKQPLERTIDVILQSHADIVGLQETGGIAPKDQPRPDRAAEIARRLGWHHFDQGGRTAIISRFEIVAPTPKKWGVKLALPSGRQLYAFNVHLAHSPYQPYQLLDIPYGDAPFIKTEAEAVKSARDSRGSQVAEMLAEVKAVAKEGLPFVLTGDFNEPSHRDWTEATAKAKLCPIEVEWPSTKSVEDAGFVDSYRAIHPDPLKSRGLTWTPTTKADDPKDHHDRIDFVFVGQFDGPKVEVKAARILGESPDAADIVVTPYPSDHRAIVAELELSPGKPATPEK